MSIGVATTRNRKFSYTNPCLAVLLLGLASPAAWAAHLDVVLVAKSVVAEASPRVDLTLRGEKKEQAPILRQGAIAHGTLGFDLEEGMWTIEAKAPGLWAAPRKVLVGKGAVRRTSVDLYEATVVRGRLEVEKGDVLPAEVGFELYQPLELPGPRTPHPGNPSLEALAFRCPVAAGDFECAVPVGLWDVRLRAAEHVSHYLWGRRFDAKTAATLGTLALKRGASVVGWVKPEGPVVQSGGCQVRLVPMQGGGSAQAEDTRRALSVNAPADSRGFFHLTAVPPGSYVLTATLAGFAPAKLFPVRVFENRESQLQEPLVLRPPVTLEVHVIPPVDLQQSPWTVQVFDLGETPGSMEKKGEGKVGADGSWKLAALAPGRFVVQVVDGAGSAWAFREQSVDFGSSQVDFDLDVVQVEGTLKLNGEPLAATLYFGGEMTVPSFKLRSDEKGRFEGAVAREGKWRIEVEAETPVVHRSLTQVEVRPPRGKSVAKLDLDLPDGRLKGRVTDEDGRPGAGATVTVMPDDGWAVWLHADGDGVFEANGFDNGRLRVQARLAGQESEVAAVQVVAKTTPVTVPLVLQRKRQVAGWVLGLAGGVPGAKVVAVAPGQIFNSEAVTDVSGRFSLSVPAAASILDLQILPPGYGFLARRVQLAGEEELRLLVDSDGGSLVLEDLPKSTEAADGAIVIAHNGVLLSSAILRLWAQANGLQAEPGSGRQVVPQVEAGQYEVCRVPLSGVEEFRTGARSAARCATGTVAPGAELTLRLPAP